MPATKPRRRARTFGNARRLPSGRWQARYRDPDGVARNAPTTFDSKTEADDWLAQTRTQMRGNRWVNPDKGRERFADYAQTWLDQRRDIKPRTRESYQRILERRLLPAFGTLRLDAITPAAVNGWYRGMPPEHPTMRARCYSLLHTMLGDALADEKIPRNPCTIKGASRVKRATTTEPATVAELQVIRDAMPPAYAAMVDLAAWCALRFGELAELRRKDIDIDRGTVRVERAVVWVKGGPIVGEPKSDAGTRTVAIPPHLLPVIEAHLDEHVGSYPDALLFGSGRGKHLPARTLHGWYFPAREAAGRPDLRFHDLRHTGATLATRSGATLKEVMARLGHSSPTVALRYQHAVAERDTFIAAQMSAQLAGGTVTPIADAPSKRQQRA
jgi:integrase